MGIPRQNGRAAADTLGKLEPEGKKIAVEAKRLQKAVFGGGIEQRAEFGGENIGLGLFQ
jgi:HJR/Mrr/RecB family endonuclease